MKTIAGIGLTLSVLLVIGLLCGAIISNGYADEGKAARNIQLPSNTRLYVNGNCVVDCPVTRPALFLQAITLDAQDGHELDRKNVSGPYESVEDCSAAQQATGTQHVERARGLPSSSGMLQVTVFMCVALQGGVTS